MAKGDLDLGKLEDKAEKKELKRLNELMLGLAGTGKRIWTPGELH